MRLKMLSLLAVLALTGCNADSITGPEVVPAPAATPTPAAVAAPPAQFLEPPQVIQGPWHHGTVSFSAGWPYLVTGTVTNNTGNVQAYTLAVYRVLPSGVYGLRYDMGTITLGPGASGQVIIGHGCNLPGWPASLGNTSHAILAALPSLPPNHPETVLTPDITVAQADAPVPVCF
jgi:hypothetical protein